MLRDASTCCESIIAPKLSHLTLLTLKDSRQGRRATQCEGGDDVAVENRNVQREKDEVQQQPQVDLELPEPHHAQDILPIHHTLLKRRQGRRGWAARRARTLKVMTERLWKVMMGSRKKRMWCSSSTGLTLTCPRKQASPKYSRPCEMTQLVIRFWFSGSSTASEKSGPHIMPVAHGHQLRRTSSPDLTQLHYRCMITNETSIKDSYAACQHKSRLNVDPWFVHRLPASVLVSSMRDEKHSLGQFPHKAYPSTLIAVHFSVVLKDRGQATQE